MNDTFTKKQYSTTLFIASAAMLLLITIFLHFWQLGDIPNGFGIDESSIGYNALCIAKTGAGEHGIKWPLFFKCFGNYQDPVMVYVLAPLVKIFGLSKAVVRFPSALFHICASIALFFLARYYCRNRFIALLGAFAFSVLPWVFPLSRSTMSGYTPMLLGIVTGWLFLFKAIGKQSQKYAVIAATGWAFAMYSHNCGRPTTAAILIVFTLTFNTLLIKRWKTYLTFCTSYVLFMMPMTLSLLNRTASMTNRFNTISVWKDNPSAIDLATRITIRYFDYFSPSFLFIKGDAILRHHTRFGGELFLFMIPLVVIGFVYLIKHAKQNVHYRFALIGLLVYPLAAILTVDRFHSTRSINGAPYWSILAIAGAYCLWRSKPRWHKLLCLLLLAVIIEISCYSYHFFMVYPKISRSAFQAPFIEALEYGVAKLKKGETIYISPTAFPWGVLNRNFKPYFYSDILFFSNIPPSIYQQGGIPREIVYPFEGVIHNSGILINATSVIRRTNDPEKTESIPFNETVPAKAKLLRTIPTHHKNRRYQIYRIGDIQP